MAKHNLKDLEQSQHQAEIGFQASIVQHPYRKRSPKRELPGRVFKTRKKRWNASGHDG